MTESAVVIVNYNAGSLLTDAVHSALEAGAARVVVVDNASKDDSIGNLRRTLPDPRVAIVENEDNRGFATACNQGWQAASERLVLFLNPDGRLEPGALEVLEQSLLADAHVGMVGPLLLNPDGSEQRGGRRKMPGIANSLFSMPGFGFLSRLWPARFGEFNLNEQPVPKRPVEVEALSGGCMLVRREVLAVLGGWDEGYFLHVEDLDICHRCRLAGYGLLFVPGAVAVHVKGASSSGRPIFVEWHKHLGMIRFFDKFQARNHPWPVVLLIKAAVWLRFVLVAMPLLTKHAVRKLRHAS